MYNRVLLGESETGRTRMMKKFTGLPRSLLDLAKPREKRNRTREGLGKDFPNWRTSEQDLQSNTEEPRERAQPPEGLVDEGLQGLPLGSR